MHDKNYIGGWDSYFEPNKANTNWGKWGPVKLCPSNGFGIGFDLKVCFKIRIIEGDYKYIYIYIYDFV